MPLHSLLNPNGDDMHVGFQFESFVSIKTQRRYQARSVSIRAGTPRGRRRRCNPGAGAGAVVPGATAPPPAGLHHDYDQIHHLCNALRC